MEQSKFKARSLLRPPEGPLASHIDAFSMCLSEPGFKPRSWGPQLRLVAKFSGWLKADAVDLTVLTDEHLYRDRMAVTASPLATRLDAELPPGIRKGDPNFGVVEVYHDAMTMKVVPAGTTALDVTSQGCADAGLCYPPQTQTIQVAAAAAAVAAPPGAAARPADAGVAGLWAGGIGSTGSDSQIKQWLGERSLGWTLRCFSCSALRSRSRPVCCRCCPSSRPWSSAARHRRGARLRCRWRSCCRWR